MKVLVVRRIESNGPNRIRHSGLAPESSGLPIDSGFRRNDVPPTFFQHSCLLKNFSLPLFLFAWTSIATAESLTNNDVIRVGPNRTVQTIAAAAKLVPDGGVIEVDAGEYLGDVTAWNNKNVTIRANGGRVRLDPAGTSAESKGIWVVRGGKVEIEGFDFVNAAVPDRNGAGIRLEKGHLVVRNSTFTRNENGILTGGDKDTVLEIENCEFGHNGFGDGRSHNLYVGTIAKLIVTGSYFHHANVGHLLKSRAAENHIFYNRLTDEIGGKASYELEFPNGGIAYVVGNVIQQSSTTENPNIVSYGAEGNRWPVNTLYLVNNTLVDNRPQSGVFLSVRQGLGAITAVNNLLVGQGKLETAGPGNYRNNFNVDWDEFVFAARDDFHLKPGSKLRGKGIAPPRAVDVDLTPRKDYIHQRSARDVNPQNLNPGAFQN